jgi:hypothetical protein
MDNPMCIVRRRIEQMPQNLTDTPILSVLSVTDDYFGKRQKTWFPLFNILKDGLANGFKWIHVI